MKKTTKLNIVKHNKEIYNYYIGSEKVLIKQPNGQSKLVDKHLIKGKSKPSWLKRLLKSGQRNFSIDRRDMVNYIKHNY